MSLLVYTSLLLLLYLYISPCLGFYTITGSSTYAVKGQSYLFTCDTDDSPKYVRFMRRPGTICYVISSNGQCGANSYDSRSTCRCNTDNSFYANITDISTEDDTNWYCSNSHGITSSPFKLPVYFGPENVSFKPSSNTLQVTEGTRRNVECFADCKPNCNYNWFKDNTMVSSNNTLSVINRDEAGSYTCRVQHQVITSNQTKALIVTVIYGPDSLTISTLPNLVLTEGTSTTVSCDADCYPSCTLHWYKDRVQVHNDRSLVFTYIDRAQIGNYTCQATNSVSLVTKSSVLSVVVNYSPSILSLSSTAVGNIATEGSDVTFTCTAASRPLSTLTWSKSDRPSLATGNTIILHQLRCQDTNIYSCVANNNIGKEAVSSIPLYVECTPTQKNLTNEVIQMVGQGVTLEVDVYAYPEPRFTWRQNSTGVEIQATTTKASINSYKSTVEIVLQTSLFGYYTIDAENNVGKSTYYIKITEGDPTKPEGKNKSGQGLSNVSSGVIGAVLGALLCFCVMFIILYLRRKWQLKAKQSCAINEIINIDQLDSAKPDQNSTDNHNSNAYFEMSTGQNPRKSPNISNGYIDMSTKQRQSPDISSGYIDMSRVRKLRQAPHYEIVTSDTIRAATSKNMTIDNENAIPYETMAIDNERAIPYETMAIDKENANPYKNIDNGNAIPYKTMVFGKATPGDNITDNEKDSYYENTAADSDKTLNSDDGDGEYENLGTINLCSQLVDNASESISQVDSSV